MALPLAQSSLQVSFSGGGLFVANDVVLKGFLSEQLPPVRESVAAVEVPLDALPAGAVLRAATVTITAEAPGNAGIGSVASVRAAAGDPAEASTSLVVDFGAMRTVAAVSAPVAVQAIRPWLGTSFAPALEDLSEDFDASVRTFPEVQAERLLLELDEAVDPAELASSGSVLIPTPPADLELLVNGARAAFRPGPARPGAGGVHEEAIDVTAAVQAAVDAGALPVVVALRSGIAGVLGMQVSLDFLRTHAVTFPDGIARVVDAPEEGVWHLALPLPPESATWSVHELQLTVTGRPGAGRVLPPVGHASSGAAEIVLDGDRAVVVGLPEARLSRLATVTALRLPLTVGDDGAELAGRVLDDAGGLPGAPATSGQLGPVTLVPGTAWVTLPLAEPLTVVAGQRVWVELQLARGSVRWPLAQPAAAASADAPLRRRTPSGTYRLLSAVQGVPTTTGALRVVGEPPANAPLSALDAQIEGTQELVAFTPSPDGVRVAIRLPEPVTAATPGAFAGGALLVRLTASAPGPYSFSAGKVAYA